MNNEIFQKVFNLVQPFLPEGWNKMILYVGYTVGSYSMKFYTCDSQGTYTDCFKCKEISKAKLIQLFMSVDKLLAPERRTLDEKNKWSVMTMIVDSEGNMKTEFDYTDISENTIAYEQRWKEKYIH